MYKTTCPKCGSESLAVDGIAYFSYVPLSADGFDVSSAELETDVEKVHCCISGCGWTGTLESLEDDGTVGEMLAGVFPQTLRCKNPHCGKTFMSDETTYVAVVDVYFCPHCGGTDVS